MSLQETGGWAAQKASWTEDRVAALKRHAAAGLSASQIAAELGNVTRNAVIGKLTRMGTQLRGTQAQKVMVAKPAVAKAKRKRLVIRPGRTSTYGGEVCLVEDEVTDLAPDTSEFACTIVGLEDGMCRYPLGAPAYDMNYCGAQTARGSWCGRHYRIVFNPRTRT